MTEWESPQWILLDALVWISQCREIGVENPLGINFVTRPESAESGSARSVTFSAREKNTTRFMYRWKDTEENVAVLWTAVW